MPYSPIALNARVAEPIRLFVAKQVDPYLADVRLMLRFPRRPSEPGFNLTATPVLCSVIGGLARVFYNDEPGDRASFKATAKRYPMDDEPANAVRDPETFAERLYSVFRCNLVHSLGLNMEKGATGRWTIVPILENGHVPRKIKVARWPAWPRSERMLRALDEATGRPAGLPATLSEDHGEWRLDLDALYCGVRRLARRLAEDEALHAEAVRVLAPWSGTLSESRDSPRFLYSGTNPEIVTYAFGNSVEQSLGAISGASISLTPRNRRD